VVLLQYGCARSYEVPVLTQLCLCEAPSPFSDSSGMLIERVVVYTGSAIFGTGKVPMGEESAKRALYEGLGVDGTPVVMNIEMNQEGVTDPTQGKESATTGAGKGKKGKGGGKGAGAGAVAGGSATAGKTKSAKKG
jgi:hypothetical protein